MQLRVDKAEIYFETCGDTSNPPLVLWNGAGCTLRMWDKVIPSLSSKFYVIAFDIRGAGKSINYDESLESFSFNQYSDDLNQILRNLGLKKIHIWSMAWGTRAALALSLIHI